MSPQVPAEHESENAWDVGLAAHLPGRMVLVGLTYLSANGSVERRQQFAGLVVSADARNGIRLQLVGHRVGEEYVLPPDTRVLHPAPKGEYRLRSSGEIVVDPDYTVSFTVTRSP